MSAETSNRPATPEEWRVVDLICDRFEHACQTGAADLDECLAQAPGEYRRRLLVELAAIELQYRRDRADAQAPVDLLVAAHPALAQELRACTAELEAAAAGATHRRERPKAPGAPASDVALASARQPQGLHIRCPHCACAVELLADTPEEEVTCRGCGSTFSLVDREGSAAASPTFKSLGRFELIARLGVGGFGTVWKARDPELDRLVAIKIPRRGQLRGDEVEFFFREARAAAQLRHPTIVSVHEIGREGDTVFIVSDYVHGTTLAESMRDRPPSGREAAELCLQIAEALDHAHERGVVHRDLKPSNIMIDEAGSPRLMDFGLAKRDAGELTMTYDGQILGTAAYMSPEQAAGRGHWIDRRTDVYSLGVMLFQLAVGELPFRGSFEVQLASKLTDDAPDPRRLNRHVSRDVATICLKCLERDPNRRYPTAAAVAAELRRTLAGEPIQARPLSRAGRAVRWARRKPAQAAALALAGVVAVVGPTAAFVIDSQRRQLDDRVRELDAVVVGQQDDVRRLRGENAELQRTVTALTAAAPQAPAALQWRRTLLAAVVDRHFDRVAAAAVDLQRDPAQRVAWQFGMGVMLAALERFDAAAKQLAAARETLAFLSQLQPEGQQWLPALADCCEQLAEVQRAAGHSAAAARSAAEAQAIRTALAERRPDEATAAVDRLASYYAGATTAPALEEIAALSQRLIDEWPRDASAFYHAACRLAGRTPAALPAAADDAAPAAAHPDP